MCPLIPWRQATPQGLGTLNRVSGAPATSGLIRLNLAAVVNHDVPGSVGYPFKQTHQPG